MAEQSNTQQAPYPQELADLVRGCSYRAGWRLWLSNVDYDRGQGSVGLTLVISVDTVNSYPPHEPMTVRHLFPVPPAAYNRPSWLRWLFEAYVAAEQHEAMEFFTVDGVKPFAPNHGPGWNPYIVTQLTTEVDRRTSFRGVVNPA